MYCLVGIMDFPSENIFLKNNSEKTVLNNLELVIDVALEQGDSFNGLF